MRIVQFKMPQIGRRVGIVDGETVRDITSIQPQWKRVIDIFHAADAAQASLTELLTDTSHSTQPAELNYTELLAAPPHGDQPFLRAPLDHIDHHRILIAGTGLTHLGSMQSRDAMHSSTDDTVEPVTDSKKIFQMGVEGGKPVSGRRGVAPEWFYKGNGFNLRAHGETLDIPDFALDGGEEVEIVGCYVIDSQGQPRRLGFAVGNEWSDHPTEKINYLYLAPSKLRQCAVGPELITDCDFSELKLHCTVTRQGETIYDSGELLSGEQHMSHSLANLEDHHFKFPQHRVSGDVHLHYFGTSKLSYGSRDWEYQDGDEICVTSDNLSATLRNRVQRPKVESVEPIQVLPI